MEETEKPEDTPDEDEEEEASEEASSDSKTKKKKGLPMVDAAIEAAAKLKEQNDRQEALLAKQEELMAKQALGGRAEAGGETAKEQTDEEFAKAVETGEINLFETNEK